MRLTILLFLLALAACDIPTTYTVELEVPRCPWPPLPLSDTLSAWPPLGCPWRLDDSTVVVWPFPTVREP